MTRRTRLLILLAIVALLFLVGLATLMTPAAAAASVQRGGQGRHVKAAANLRRNQYRPPQYGSVPQQQTTEEEPTVPQQQTTGEETTTEEEPTEEVTEEANVTEQATPEEPTEEEETVEEATEEPTEEEVPTEEPTEEPTEQEVPTEEPTEEEVPTEEPTEEPTEQQTTDQATGEYVDRLFGMKRQNGDQEQDQEVEQTEGTEVEQPNNEQGDQNMGVEGQDQGEQGTGDETQVLQQQSFVGQQNDFFDICRTRHFCYRRNPFYSVTIPANSRSIYFSPRLFRRWYLIRCYGVWKPIRRRDYFCDCRWCTRNNWRTRSDTLGGYDYGLCSRELSGGNSCSDNFWRPRYSNTHSYCFEYRGRNRSVDLRVRDPFHFNNVGFLFCAIYRQC